MSSGSPLLRVTTVVPGLARNLGGPAVTLVEGTAAMAGLVDRRIFTTDAGVPAGSRPFTRLRESDLPTGAADVAVKIFPVRRPYRFIFSPELWRALRVELVRSDVVTIHSLNLFPQLAAFLGARRHGVPYIVTPHGALDPWFRTSHPWVKRATNATWQSRMLENAAALHFTTPDEAALAADVAPRVRRVIVPNGVMVARFRKLEDNGRFRTRYLQGSTSPVVLFFGRLARKKGIDLLIRGFARATVAQDAQLAIVGPDDENLVPPLRELASDCGVADRVTFAGPLYGQDQLDALGSADIWALTSHTENFGNAVMEAMATGLPVLVSSAVNLAGAISACGSGVVTGLDVGEIAGHLERLLREPDERRELGRRAAAFADQYDWHTVAPQLVEMFRSVAGDSRRY